MEAANHIHVIQCRWVNQIAAVQILKNCLQQIIRYELIIVRCPGIVTITNQNKSAGILETLMILVLITVLLSITIM